MLAKPRHCLVPSASVLRARAPSLLAVAAINLPKTHHLAPELRLVALSSPEEGIDLRC